MKLLVLKLTPHPIRLHLTPFPLWRVGSQTGTIWWVNDAEISPCGCSTYLWYRWGMVKLINSMMTFKEGDFPLCEIARGWRYGCEFITIRVVVCYACAFFSTSCHPYLWYCSQLGRLVLLLAIAVWNNREACVSVHPELDQNAFCERVLEQTFRWKSKELYRSVQGFSIPTYILLKRKDKLILPSSWTCSIIKVFILYFVFFFNCVLQKVSYPGCSQINFNSLMRP